MSLASSAPWRPWRRPPHARRSSNQVRARHETAWPWCARCQARRSSNQVRARHETALGLTRAKAKAACAVQLRCLSPLWSSAPLHPPHRVQGRRTSRLTSKPRWSHSQRSAAASGRLSWRRRRSGRKRAPPPSSRSSTGAGRSARRRTGRSARREQPQHKQQQQQHKQRRPGRRQSALGRRQSGLVSALVEG